MLGKHTSNNKKENITVGELKKMLENFHDDDIISVMHYVEFGLKETFPIHNVEKRTNDNAVHIMV